MICFCFAASINTGKLISFSYVNPQTRRKVKDDINDINVIVVLCIPLLKPL